MDNQIENKNVLSSAYKTNDLMCIKLYLIKNQKVSYKSMKMYCIIIHLNIDLFTFNKYCICKLLYMTGTKLCYNLYGFVDIFVYTPNPSKV